MKRVASPVMAWPVLLAVIFGPESAVAQGSKPDVWAVVIGVDRYEDSLIPACPGARRDAQTVASWLANTAGWGGNVLRMDDLGQKAHGPASAAIANLLPTRANLDWALTDWLGHRVKKNDIVVIYFAGQATARAPKPGEPAGRAYLLPIDARAADVAGYGWSLDDALDRAKALADRQARVVLWLDTSTSGRGARGMTPEPGSPSGDDWLRALTRWPGVTAWLAADGKPAAEGAGGQPGPFVGSLLKAMGTIDRAHNLLGCLKGLRDDPEVLKRGFKTMGAVGPAVSLWSGGALVVEEAVPELIVQAGHGDRVTSVLVLADNTHAITASQDSTVRVWNLADRSLVRVLTDPIVGVESMALDTDGAVLMAGDGVGRLIGWDMTRDRPRPFFGPPGHAAQIVSIAFLPGSKSFVALDSAHRSILWDAGRGDIRKVRAFADQPLGRIAVASRPAPGTPALAASVETLDKAPGSILLFDAAGRPTGDLPGPGGRISALDLSADGKLLAAGDSDGKVVVLDPSTRAVVYQHTFSGEIRLARLSKTGLLLVSDHESLRLIEPRAGGAEVVLRDGAGKDVPGEVDRAEFSDDGRWLAVCTSGLEGRPLAWRVADPSKPEPVAIPEDEIPGLSPAFSPDGKSLIVGDVDGGVRAWGLEEGPGGPKAGPRPRILPARGKVASLSPSRSGRFLLEITRDDIALLWDLEKGRGCKALPGPWCAGAILPDESKLILLTRPDQGGDLVLFDRARGERLPNRFERPKNGKGRPSTVPFGSLSLSKTGRWAAAASLKGFPPLACVWNVETGQLVHVAQDHNNGLTGVDLSDDESYLLTASEDGSAKLWPLDDPRVELHRPVATFFNPANDGPAITSARVCPGNPGRVLTGTAGGHVFLWEWEKDRPKRNLVPLGDLDGEINAVSFSADGLWATASGSREKTIRFWSIPRSGPSRPVRFLPQPHHGEQVGALIPWPNGTMIVSGGDDAAVRFWDLKDHALIGTLVAESRDPTLVEWLAFTPEGLFDGSLPGEAMVKWRVGEKIVTLEQSQDTHHVFQLAGAFAGGEKPKIAALKDDGPRLKIATPDTDRTLDSRAVELTVWTGDPDPADIRLYQNGMPVRDARDFGPGRSPNFRTTRVTLRKGENRFYAMASKPGSLDGRSDEVTLRYEGPEPPGLVHTLAIGVSDYDKRPLKYAHLDARQIAEFLTVRGAQGPKQVGKQIVLLDRDVTPENVDNAFRTLRDSVKGKPNDTVVLFLAGHTDTDPKTDQFCLLLPDFPFQGPPPLGVVASRGDPGVMIRGNAAVGSFNTRVGDPEVMPYSLLYNRMTRLEALQRLIIVDACQAGSILDDPAVRSIQRLVERGARKARNSYLLAARRGEPANEADALEHGLLTYALLRGLGATGLKPIPEALGGFPGPRSADLNNDQLVTSAELAAFANQSLPRLAQMFPLLVARAGNAPPVPGPFPARLEENLKIQNSETSFTLINLPAPRP